MYAAAAAGIGVLLVSTAFIYVWAPVPRWIPWRTGLACGWGAVMLLAAAGLQLRRIAPSCAAILVLQFLAWLVVLQAPRIIAAPAEELLWSGAAQLVAIAAGGWVLFASLGASRSSAGDRLGRWLRGRRGVRGARSVYALALPMFGVHHFLAGAGAAAAVPAWLPLRPELAFLTGAAHIAAGAAIFLGIVPRLAAKLEAIMITAFVVLVHVPGIVGAPAEPLQWTMLFVAAAIAGAAWVVALSYPQAAATAGQACDRDDG